MHFQLGSESALACWRIDAGVLQSGGGARSDGAVGSPILSEVVGALGDPRERIGWCMSELVGVLRNPS